MQVYKKANINTKQNYPPESTVSNLTKVFKILIYSQINANISDKFIKHLKGFRKKQNWKSNLNKENKIRAFCVDLIKAFDTLDHPPFNS